AIGGAGNVAAGWTAAWWLAYAWTTGNVLGVGTITSGGTSGSFAFALPSGYTGRIFVQVEVHNQTQVSGAYSYATVLPPALTVTPSELFYLPGDTITVSVSTQGQVFQGSTLYELVTNANSQQVSNGSIGGGSFQIHVPSIDASGSYTVSVWAVATDGSVIASSLTSLSEFIGLTLHVGVQTPSSYADGSYQPGQALQLSYSLAPSGPVSAPRTFLLEIAPGFLFFGGGPGSVADQVNGASGSVGYSVPSNIGSGAQMFTVFAVIPGCVPTCSVVTSFSILVNSHPSVFSMEVPAGSGLTVGWIVLLVLIVLVAVALFVGLRRRGRPMVLRPESHATAPAASPAPAAWSEPATPSSSGGPPPGAQ
ncbi:MAG TPA: hypothetical protein VJS68_02055, partial [Thermoplasmata archaeon]|nr:hypothetical protein [Thermoplasmata archaeon]